MRSTTTTTAGRRPAAVLSLGAVLLFLGISALAGGVALTLNGSRPPQDWLGRIPLVDTWVVPGLVLGVGFGLGSVLVAYGVLFQPRWPWLSPVERITRHHWAWTATIGLGLGHISWIVLELFYLPELSVLQLVYGAVGVTLVSLPMLPSVGRHLAARAEGRGAVLRVPGPTAPDIGTAARTAIDRSRAR
jgi:hypothetical protein